MTNDLKIPNAEAKIDTPPGEPVADDAVLAERVTQLFAHTKLAVTGMTLSTLFVAGLFAPRIGLQSTLATLFVMIVPIVLRGGIYWLHRRDPSRWPDKTWHNLVIVLQTYLGLTWASVMYLFPVDSGAFYIEALILNFAFMVAVNIMAHGTVAIAAAAFTLPVMVSFAAYFFQLGAPLAQVIGGFIVLLTVLHLFSMRSYQSMMTADIRRRLANRRLFHSVVAERDKADNAHRYLMDVLNALDFTVSVMDENFCYVAWNDALIEAGHVPPDMIKKGLPLEDAIRANAQSGVYGIVGDPDELVRNIVAMMKDTYQKGGNVLRHSMGDGREIEVRCKVMDNGHIVSSHIDVTEHKKAVIDTIRHMAYHDNLTDLPNREGLRDILDEVLRDAESRNTAVGLIVFDIRRFRDINETMGHPVGDGVLRVVTGRLLELTSENDTVCRLGSDEFAILLKGATSAEDVTAFAEHAIKQLSEPIEFNNKRFAIDTVAGISVYPDDAVSVDQIMVNADLAVNKAKESDSSSWQLFDEGMNDDLLEQTSLQNDIRRALDREEFTIHYQPEINLKSGEVTGAEALIRWDHPERGWVPPGKFIPIAELSRLIVPLTEWILPEACREAKTWIGRGWCDLVVSVNLSPLHFKTEGLVELVSGALNSTGLPARNLELEITEGMVIPDAERVIGILEALNDLGVKLAIDDFGTGYSSMSYLKTFPFHKLKIDRSFIRDLARDPEAESVVEAIIRVGHSLGHVVVAEGVETLRQVEILTRLGCDIVQGFYYTVPLPGDTFLAWINERRARQAGDTVVSLDPVSRQQAPAEK